MKTCRYCFILLCIIYYSCNNISFNYSYKQPVLVNAIDTIIQESSDSSYKQKNYDKLILIEEKKITSAPGTKSVLFNHKGSKLYAMNLEGMSVFEFDQQTKKISREFRFIPTPGLGWDYQTDKPVQSFQEKPVEACLTNNDSILWVSLHNAEGIVPIRLFNIDKNGYSQNGEYKKAVVFQNDLSGVDTISLPLIKTGKTPKVISATKDERHLLVSNWHSNTVSVLEINGTLPPFARLVRKVHVQNIPRGIAINEKFNESYIAVMGGSSIHVVNNNDWSDKRDIQVASNPRHLITDDSGLLYVSFNKISRVSCIDPVTGKTLFSAATHAQPRSIQLSRNNRFLFVTCYSGNMVDVFKIENHSFVKVASLPCSGKPVGIDLFEDEHKLEAWVCSYMNGRITVFTFNKM